MNKSEFLIVLRKKLKKLPEEEVENAISYYEEYFDDAGVENEQKVIDEIGTPSNVAAKIIGELAVNETGASINSEKKKGNNGISILMIITAIFASPIALPIGVAIVTIVLALVLVVVSVYLSFMVAGIGVAMCGLASFLVSFVLFVPSFPNALLMLGMGLILMAMGVAICIGIFELTKITFFGIKKLLAKFLVKGATK